MTKGLEGVRERYAEGRERGRNYDHPGARASRPLKTRRSGRDLLKRGFGALCEGVPSAVDGRLFSRNKDAGGTPALPGGSL